MIRQLIWMVIDAFHHKRERDLFIDLKRVNQEDCRIRRLGLDEDVDYRNRVMQRMTEGSNCTLPPLYVGTPQKKRKKRIKLVSFRKTGNGAA